MTPEPTVPVAAATARRRAAHAADLAAQQRTTEAARFLDALTDDEARSVATAAVVLLAEGLKAVLGPARTRAMLARIS